LALADLTGVGLGESRQKMFFLPEAHTIHFSPSLVKETGLIGTTSVLALFALLGMRGLRIAARHPQQFGSLLAFGCTFLLVGQAGLNMAVVLGLLPRRGCAAFCQLWRLRLNHGDDLHRNSSKSLARELQREFKSMPKGLKTPTRCRWNWGTFVPRDCRC